MRGDKMPEMNSSRDSLPVATPWWRRVWLLVVDNKLLLCALSVPFFLCAAKLNLDVWHDEAYTLAYFVSGGWGQITTDYHCANNHLFYLMVLYPFYWLAGLFFNDTTFFLRLPSLFISMGTLFFVYRTLKRQFSAEAGVLGVLWLGLNQMFLGHTMQLRGYGLSMLFMAILADYAFRQERPQDGWRRRGIMALVLGCFLYTLPSNVLFAVPLAGAALAVCWSRNGGSIKAVLLDFWTWLLGPLLAALAYLPIVGQVLAFSESARVGPQSLLHLEAASAYYRACWKVMNFDAPWFWGVLGLALGIACLGCRKQQKEGLLFVLQLALSLYGPLFLLFVVPGERLLTRNFTVLLPLFALLAGSALWMLLDCVRQRFFSRQPVWAFTLAGMLVLYSIFLAPVLTYPQRLVQYREKEFSQDGYYNYYLANFHSKAVVEYLQKSLPPDENYLISLDQCTQFDLLYYMAVENFSRRRLVAEVGKPCFYRLYYITYPKSEISTISMDVGLSSATLRQMPLEQDFGYYKLYKSPNILAESDFAEKLVTRIPAKSN